MHGPGISKSHQAILSQRIPACEPSYLAAQNTDRTKDLMGCIIAVVFGLGLARGLSVSMTRRPCSPWTALVSG